MQQSKIVAALVLAGTFAAGGAIGYAGDHLARAEAGDCRVLDSRDYWNRLGTEWGITPSQRRVIDSLMDAQRVRISALWAPLRPRMDSINAMARAVSDSTQAHLRQVLTPEQRVKLDQVRAEVRQREATYRAHRDEDLEKIR